MKLLRFEYSPSAPQRELWLFCAIWTWKSYIKISYFEIVLHEYANVWRKIKIIILKSAVCFPQFQRTNLLLNDITFPHGCEYLDWSLQGYDMVSRLNECNP
jgi:hypothetical protein